MSGGRRAPQPQPAAPAPDPDAERVKLEEAARKTDLEKRSKKGSTIATSPQGVLGDAPINAPKLTARLGQGA